MFLQIEIIFIHKYVYGSQTKHFNNVNLAKALYILREMVYRKIQNHTMLVGNKSNKRKCAHTLYHAGFVYFILNTLCTTPFVKTAN